MIASPGSGSLDVEEVVAAVWLAVILGVVGWVIVLPLLFGVVEDAGRWWRGR